MKGVERAFLCQLNDDGTSTVLQIADAPCMNVGGFAAWGAGPTYYGRALGRGKPARSRLRAGLLWQVRLFAIKHSMEFLEP